MAIVLTAAVSASATSWVRSYQYADDDTGAAVRIARACLEVGHCPGTGTNASALGLLHGAAWIRLISLFLVNGGGLQATQIAVLVFLILSGLVTVLIVDRYISRRAALLTMLLFLPPTMATAEFADLANPTLLPLPLAAYYALLALYIESGRLATAIGASLCLAMAMGGNIASVLIVPLHVAVLGLSAKHPVATVVAGCLSLAVAFGIDSHGAALALAGLVLDVRLGGVILGAAGIIAMSRSLRRRLGSKIAGMRHEFASRPVKMRVRATMRIALGYLSVTIWVSSLLGGSGMPGARFVAPMVFPALVLAADSTDRLSRPAAFLLAAVALLALGLLPRAPLGPDLLGGLLSVVLSAWMLLATVAHMARRRAMAWHDLAASPSTVLAWTFAAFVMLASFPDALVFPRTRAPWPVRASEKVVRSLYESGLTYPGILGSLQGQSPFTIQSMVATFDPDLFRVAGPVVDPGWSLLALIVPPAVVSRTSNVIVTVPIDRARSAIVVRADSDVDRTDVRTCYARACGEGADAEHCMMREPEKPVRHQRPYFQVDDGVTPGSGSVGLTGQRERRTYCLTFLVGLHTSASGVPHFIRVAELWPLRLQIRRVSGVRFEGQLPGPEVRLMNDGKASGTLELEVAGDGFGPDSGWLEEPPLIEVSAPNEHLLAPFRERRITLR